MTNTEEMILYELSNGIATVTINREKQGNALNQEVMEGLFRYFNQAKDDIEARVIVLTGAGDRTFCAGADLKGGMMAGGMLEMHDKRGVLADLFLAMQENPKPILCRVNGKAIAGGMGLAIACDLVVASDDALFFTPEIDRGLFPMMIIAQIIRNLGRKKALELVLTGNQITATEAQTLGLINYAVAKDQLDAKVQQIAENLASKSPAVLGLGKKAFYQSQDMDFKEALRYLQAMLTVNTLSEDTKEGIMAFIEKRKPNWKGK